MLVDGSTRIRLELLGEEWHENEDNPRRIAILKSISHTFLDITKSSELYDHLLEALESQGSDIE